MEPTVPFYKQNSVWQVFAIIVLLLGVIALLSYTIKNYQREDAKNLKEAAYQRHIADSTKAANEAEIVALRADLELYSDNKELYAAVTEFNKVTKTLKYHEGDMVYCKPDSTRALIIGVIISGSKYYHSVKYRVQTKFDDGLHELYPSEIY
jgi:hypothetical protein